MEKINFYRQECISVKKVVVDTLRQFDNEEDSPSKILFNVYPSEMSSIVRLIVKREKCDAVLIQLKDDRIRFLEGELRRANSLLDARQNIIDRHNTPQP